MRAAPALARLPPSAEPGFQRLQKLCFHARPPPPPAALQVCYYRDKNSINKFQLAKVTQEGVTISGEAFLRVN